MAAPSGSYPWDPGEDLEDEDCGLTITPLSELPDWALVRSDDDPWRHITTPSRPARAISDSERALAASFEKYADQLDEIEDLRSGRRPLSG